MPGPPRAGRAQRLILSLISVSIPVLVAAASAVRGADSSALPEAGWLELSLRPATLMLHPGDAASDAVAHLTLVNTQERTVRIAQVRIAYLLGDETLRVEAPGEPFFESPSGPRAAKLDRGARAEWRGICLEGVPPQADRTRIELELFTRLGAAPRRVRQWVDAPLIRPPAPVALQLPFEGTWKVSQGHGCRSDHRLGGYGADFAWDFVAIDARTGRSVSDSFAGSRRNRDTVSFGRPVFAPVAGRVVRIESDVRDNDALRDYPRRSLVDDLSQPLWNLGNFIVVELGEGGPYLLVAHLRRGSIRVAPGDVLDAGDLVAEVGNSGRTIEPHLHVQLMDRADAADRGVIGIPARFRDYVELTSRSVTGKRDSVLRRVSEGDPPEGSIVIRATTPRGEEKPAPQSGG